MANSANLPVFVSTESEDVYQSVKDCRILRRPEEYATDTSPDVEWVKHALNNVACDAFLILRPTSPFRTVKMIEDALQLFFDVQPDSLRAVSEVKQTPYKMWVTTQHDASPTIYMRPLIDQYGMVVPYHDAPTQTHPNVYVQNASLEIAWRATVERHNSISGRKIVPFFTENPQDFDINSPSDWLEAEEIAERIHPK